MKYNKQRPLLMIPGPVESHESILKGISKRVYAHSESDFITAYQESLKNLRTIFDVSQKYSPLIISGSGTLAMELSMINLIDLSKKPKVLICSSGYFGTRFTQIAEAFGIEYEIIKSEIGKKFAEEELSTQLESFKPDIAFIQHVDTSTGVANDVELFGKLCDENNVISVVDGVCSIGGQEIHQKKWNIDICFTGSQKALGVPPGLAIMMYSPKSKEITESRNTKIPSYYADISNWWPVMDAYEFGSVRYFSTPPTNLICGLYESIKLILKEGMEARYNRHKQIASNFRNSLINLGFNFITSEESWANTLSTPKYLDKDNAKEFREKMLENGVLIAGGIQKGIANEYFRVGHMGYISNEEISFTVDAIKKSIA